MNHGSSREAGEGRGRRRAIRGPNRRLCGLGVALLIVTSACERVDAESDPHRAAAGSPRATHAEVPGPEQTRAPEGVVAWIGDEPVMVAEVRSWLGDGDPHDPVKRRMAVEGVIARRLVARAEGIPRAGQRERASRAEQRARADQAATAAKTANAAEEAGSRRGHGESTSAAANPPRAGIDALFERLRSELSLSETELRAHYEKTRSRYLARQIRLRREVFATDPRAASAAAPDGADANEATQAPDRWWPGAPSGASAAGKGTDGTNARVADHEIDVSRTEPGTPQRRGSTTPVRLDSIHSEVLGPAPLRDLPRSLLPEILELQAVGDQLVIEREGEAEATWVELLEILPAEPLPFERVREQVEASLRTLRGQEAMRARLAELRARSSVRIDEAALGDDRLWGPATETSPGAGRQPPFSSSSPPSSPFSS